MENILNYFQSPAFNIRNLLITAAILLIGSLVLGLIGRFVFGKKSILNVSVSSSFGILFIYGVAVVFFCFGGQFSTLSAPLPFVRIIDQSLVLFDFFSADFSTLCSEILSMIMLALLVNIADTLLPKSKNIFSWLFFRALTVALGYLLHLVVVWIFTNYLPGVILTYAPVVLLVILILMILTGALKFLIGALLVTVNPIIGALYTFFFANIVGRQITKAVLTTAIISALIIALKYAGITAIAITSAALIAYLPFVILLVASWYLLCCIL